jgi:F420-non-reducing hydrogenase small subunit
MSNKLKVAFYWGASCGGCEVSFLDINEKILEVSALIDVVIMPVAFDGKYKDIEALPEKGIDVCFFNGGIRNSEAESLAKLLREKSRIMIAYGACASWGGIPGLANQFHAEDILKRVYETTPSTNNPQRIRPAMKTAVPEGVLEIPKFYDKVFPLDEIVTVEYYLPGCPPTVAWVLKAVEAIASNTLPPAGSVIGLEKTLCDECPREKSSDRKIKKFFRPHEIIADTKKCLLDQGLICCGPATRGGCGAKCMEVNMPCRGCYGPPPGIRDQGAKMLSVITCAIDSHDEQEIARIVSDIKDPIGTFYQFSLAQSILKGVVK